MSKTGKFVLLIVSIAILLLIGVYISVVSLWNGTFNFMHPKEISTYSGPNGEYSLVFEQIGDPAWPFGPTDVRLTLVNHDGEIIESVSTQLFDDGANANEYNVAYVSWKEDSVFIVLRASEMADKEIIFAIPKK